MLPLLLFSSLCSESSALFNTLDYIATNLLLPIVAIGICVYVGWYAPRNLLQHQLTNDGTLHSQAFPVVRFVIRYVAPLLIIAVLAGAF